MKVKLLKKLRKYAKRVVKFELDNINYIRDSYNIKSYVGRFYYIYYDEYNNRSKPPYLQDTCLEVYTEDKLKRKKQKLIENSVYYMMRWMKFQKKKRILASSQKKINETF